MSMQERTPEPLPAEPGDVMVFTQPVQDSPRARRYMAAFDRSVEAAIRQFDTEKGLIKHTIPDGAPGVAPEVAQLDRFTRKNYISPLTHWAYGVGRTSASFIGVLAYAYAQPLSRYYHDAALLQAVCRGFDAFIEHQAPSGEFVFTPIRYSSVYGTHEMAWRLECFITAYFCIRDALTEDQRTRYWGFLNRAMRFLQATPCDHPCNRGVVWTTVMSYCWQATGDTSYLRDARYVWDHIRDYVFHESGQVNEGPGPCNVYSPVSYEYLLRFRIVTGDTTLDPIIVGATDWMREMYSDQLVAFQGASTRYDAPDAGDKVVPMLLAFEMYVEERPSFADMADAFLRVYEERYAEHSGRHGGIAWIAAAAHHRPDAARRARGQKRGDWMNHHSLDATQYYTVGTEGYQTMITVRSLPAKKGLQTWCARGERPFIFPERDRVSTVRGWGFDLAGRDCTPQDWDRCDRTDVASVSAAHGPLRVTHLVAPQSTIVIHTLDAPEARETIWTGSGRHIRGYTVSDERVTADGAKGALHWWGPPPTVSDDGLQIVFRDASATQVFGFTTGEFRREAGARVEGEAIVAEWRDVEGHYVALVNHSERTVSASVSYPDGRSETVELVRGQALVRRVGDGL